MKLHTVTQSSIDQLVAGAALACHAVYTGSDAKLFAVVRGARTCKISATSCSSTLKIAILSLLLESDENLTNHFFVVRW